MSRPNLVEAARLIALPSILVNYPRGRVGFKLHKLHQKEAPTATMHLTQILSYLNSYILRTKHHKQRISPSLTHLLPRVDLPNLLGLVL